MKTDVFNIKVIYRDGKYISQISSNISNLDENSQIGLFAKATVTAMNKYYSRLSQKKKDTMLLELLDHPQLPDGTTV